MSLFVNFLRLIAVHVERKRTNESIDYQLQQNKNQMKIIENKTHTHPHTSRHDFNGKIKSNYYISSKTEEKANETPIR